MPFARVNGNMLYYRENGEGRLAVFIHGFPLDHSMWLDQLAGLAHVRRCVAVDLRGFGKSDPIIDPSLSMEMMADDVAGLIDGLGSEQADIVGLSMGGYVALALWELRPTLVRSITLMDTKATADTPEVRAARDDLADRLLDSGSQGTARHFVESLLSRTPTRHSQARVRSMVEGTRYETILAALTGMKERPDRSQALPTISVPALVIGGEEDVLTGPDTMRAMAQKIPGARTTIVPHAGHLPPVENPDVTNEALIELFEGRKVVWWRGEHADEG